MATKNLSNVEMYRILADPILISELEPEQIEGLLTTAADSLVETPYLVNVNSNQPIIVVGDLHGNFESLEKIYTTFQLQGAEYCIFLGDYVDRGDMSVEVLNFLLVLRQRYGPNVVLLRGNHEDWEMNKTYGFATELEVKGLSELRPLYERLYNLFPIACVVNSTVLCIHGGVPTGISRIGEIATLAPLQQASAFMQMIWNDPMEELGLTPFEESPRGDGIYYFGEQAFRAFMEANDCSKMIRAHEWQPDGFRWFFGGNLLSIFSAENYNGLMNPACVAIIQGTTVEPHLL